ncbi:MAG TPA: VWA domain-containing protein [Spirochaetota bacterium]|nr:VWA domain-containing protein [Spirochaetota bacterium]HOL57113.1 VWA domain-containing protein [Spirochaetota bacterium]HPP04723.1 VWA domain-containing protein [Spirochaetota bacterium]
MFENVYYFFGFLLLPFIVLIFVADILILRKRAKIVAGDKLQYIIPYYSEGQKWLRMVLYLLGFSLCIVALARPRWGVETIEADVKGRDIMIVLDVSYSMNATDIIPNRLEAAKRNIEEILEMESGDRIGIIVFTEKAELIVPITNDYAAINFFLESVYPGMLGKGGTNISNAVLTALDSFDDTDVRNKMILLMTDGEDLEGNFYSMLKKAEERKIKIFTVGIGTESGKPIPIRNASGEIESYIKDENGRHVISRLDEKKLLQIAQTTGGSYMRISNRKGEMKNFLQSITSIEKREQDKLKYEQKKERYDIFLIPALILFALGFILDQGRIIRINKNRFEWLFNKNFILFIFVNIFLLVPFFGYSNNDASSDFSEKKKFGSPNSAFWGNVDFKKGKYQEALQKYWNAIDFFKENELAKLYYNIANTYYKLNNLDNATKFYENAMIMSKDDILKSKIFYNQGLVSFKKGDYQTAAEFFKNAIKYNEKDDDARYNYEVCKLLAERQKKQNNNQQQQNQNNNQQQSKDVENMLNSLDEKEKQEMKQKREAMERNNRSNGRYW